MNQTHIFLDDEHPDGSNKKLAIDRTVFAFERTALAYLRTGTTFLIAGITLIKLFDNKWVNYLGFLLFPLAFYMYLLGLQKYSEVNEFLHKVGRRSRSKNGRT